MKLEQSSPMVKKILSLDKVVVGMARALAERTERSVDEIVEEAISLAVRLDLEPLPSVGKTRRLRVELDGKLVSGLKNLSGLARAGLVEMYLREVSPRREETRLAEVLPPKIDELVGELLLVRRIVSRSPGTEDPLGRAALVREIIYLLADELEFFKTGPEERREAFRREVPPEDVGYLTTLLRALYSEDRFQRWLLTSDYRGGGR